MADAASLDTLLTIADARIQDMENQHLGNTKYNAFSFEVYQGDNAIISHTLSVGVEDLTREDGINATITQTLGGAFADDFGLGLITYNLKGTTGYATRTTAEGITLSGLSEFQVLRDAIIRYFEQPGSNAKDRMTSEYSLVFHDWSMGEHFVVQPVTKFQLARSKSRPLLYAFDFTFVVLGSTSKGVSTGTTTRPDPINVQIKTMLADLTSTFVVGTNLARIIMAGVQYLRK